MGDSTSLKNLMLEYEKVDTANKEYIDKKKSLEQVLSIEDFKTVLNVIHKNKPDDTDSIEYKVLDSLVSMNFKIDSAINQFIYKHIQNREGEYNDVENI
jgi:hypothetical protein